MVCVCVVSGGSAGSDHRDRELQSVESLTHWLSPWCVCVLFQVALQALIIVTGNYNFFNLLTIILCIPLLDDEVFWGSGKRAGKDEVLGDLHQQWFFCLVLSLFLSYPFQLLAHSPDLFFPKPLFSER